VFVRPNYDHIAVYNNAHAKVFGISVDSVFSLKKFKAEQQLNFGLLSDFNKEVSTRYGCMYENWILDMQGVSKRSAFLINRKGIIQYAEILENAGEIPDFDAIQAKLAAIG
jgi:peroxiredoxin